MANVDAMKAVRRLMVAFRQDITPEAIELYAEKLSDLPTATLAAVVEHAIDNQTFFPAVGELRRIAARMCGLLPDTPAAALALIRAADVREAVYRRDGSLAYEERYWRWPEGADPLTLELARDTIERVGEPCDVDGKNHFGWETGFQKTYETQAEGMTRKVVADLSCALLPGHEPKRLTGGAL